MKEPRGRLARWLVALAEYDFTVQHVPGRENVSADALSRRVDGTSNHEEEKEQEIEDGTERLEEVMMPCLLGVVGLEADWTVDEVSRLPRQDPVIGKVMQQLETQSPPPASWGGDRDLRSYKRLYHQLQLTDGMLYRDKDVTLPGGKTEKKEVVVVPRALVPEVLQQVHEKSGHLGIEKTLARVTERYWWPGYTMDGMDWVRCCETCARRKGPAINPRAPLISVPIGAPLEMLAMDALGPLPLSNKGNKYMLVVSDYYTKWPEVFPLVDQKAVTVAEVLYSEVITRFGVPLVLHSDQGRNFEGSVMRELCRLLGMKKARTTPYHPQCDGLVERLNRTLLDLLAKHVNENQKDWDEWIPTVLMAYRLAKHSSAQETPFKLMCLGGRVGRDWMLFWKGESRNPS